MISAVLLLLVVVLTPALTAAILPNPADGGVDIDPADAEGPPDPNYAVPVEVPQNMGDPALNDAVNGEPLSHGAHFMNTDDVAIGRDQPGVVIRNRVGQRIDNFNNDVDGAQPQDGVWGPGPPVTANRNSRGRGALLQNVFIDPNNFDSTEFMIGYGYNQEFKLRFSPSAVADPWPLPQVYKRGKVYYKLSENLKWQLSGHNCDTLDSIVARYQPNLFRSPTVPQSDSRFEAPNARLHEQPNVQKKSRKPKWPQEDEVPVSVETDSLINTLTINLSKNCSRYNDGHADESYTISVRPDGIQISASEVWGITHALETLSQLIIFQQGNTHVPFIIREVYIFDFPRFKHRGLMLDTSRHFLPKQLLLDNLDVMAQNKLNVFHWHFTDDPAFTLDLTSFRGFAKKSAFEPHLVYSPADVREIVEYARVRGIRVIPELDIPSHVFSWRHLAEDLLTKCYDETGKPNGDVGPLDPSINSTYTVVARILDELGQLFPDANIHLGGDEVPTSCWLSNPAVEKFRVSNHLQRVEDLVSHFNARVLKLLNDGEGRERTPIMWEETWKNDFKLPESVIIQVWLNDQYTLKMIAEKGFKVLFSQCWYLNYIAYGPDWVKYYNCDPARLQGELLIPNDQNILGGEVAMWGEYIDETNFMSTLWPRASAAAERLWSAANVTDVIYAARRLEAHRCRMRARGVAAAPVSGPGYCPSLRNSPQYKSAASDKSLLLSRDNDTRAGGIVYIIRTESMSQTGPVGVMISPSVAIAFIVALSIAIYYKLHHKMYRYSYHRFQQTRHAVKK